VRQRAVVRRSCFISVGCRRNCSERSLPERRSGAALHEAGNMRLVEFHEVQGCGAVAPPLTVTVLLQTR
jgi:hypothetical protein